MGKDAGSAPAAPDPYKVANAQGTENRNTFNYTTGQNRYDVNTPFGSTTWNRTPTFDEAGYNSALSTWQQQNPQAKWIPESTSFSGGQDGTNTTIPGHWEGGGDLTGAPSRDAFTNYHWTANSTLSPELQNIFSAQTGAQGQIASILSSLIPGATSALQSKPQDYNPTLATLSSWSSAQNPMTRLSSSSLPTYGTMDGDYKLGDVHYGDINRGSLDLAPDAMIRDWGGQAQGLSSAVGGPNNRDWASILGGDVMSSIAGLKDMGSGERFGQEGADAAYSAASRYLDPQFKQDQKAMEARLAEQGFVPGTPGYNQAMQNFMDTKNRAYAQAKDQALLTGHQWGQDFVGNQRNSLNDTLAGLMGMGSLGLQSDQALNKGALDYGNFNLDLNKFGLTSDQARSGEGLDIAKLKQSLQGQDFDQQKTLADMVRQSGLDANDVIAQQFGLDRDKLIFNNNVGTQDFKNLTDFTKFNNDALQQDLNNDLTAGQFNQGLIKDNNAALKDATTINNANQMAPLQRLLSAFGLLGNPTGNLPTAGNAGGSMNTTDIASLFGNQYNGQLAGYNAGVSSDNANTAAMGSVISALAMLFMSDRRMKENISLIGKSPKGYNWYSFNFKGSKVPQEGVMAQEVQEIDPSAVHEINGILHVDYSKV